ncbi:MAG: hypothetical protein A3F68_12655 [Acidobacteria bacterium RIFCSPLOWO2_12_FULL_54_10]|nr:MAG: hypothetical protein A3F68_12655 [Acidobacteria bacterium RIFCSPLOWO2_12_FULL_54_10]
MQQKNSGKRIRNLLFWVLALPIFVYAFSTGPIPAVTGGFGEPTCNQAGCHVGIALNGGPGSVVISAPDTYTSGATVPIAVTVSDPNQRRWGFELSVRTQPNGQQAGTLVPGGDGFTQIVSEGGIQYIEHTFSGTRNGTTQGASFNFNWQAPPTSAGPVVFHVAANAANGDFNNTGDRIYSSSKTVQPQQSAPAAPSVNDGGVLNSASYNIASTTVAPGTIAIIFGTNLTANGTSCVPPDCNPTLGQDGKLGTTMAGAQVKVNGAPVPIFYALPLQLAVQIPTELTGTSATVEVTVNGQTSAARTVLMETQTPGIYTNLSTGSGPGSITHADGSLVTVQNPAHRGEFIIIYGTGLGAVNPPVATGILPGNSGTEPHRTVTQVTVTIDGINVPADFAGLAGCCAGLNQINVLVPQTTRIGNDIAVRLTMGTKQSNPVIMAVGDSAPAPPPDPGGDYGY